ncbi:hypothetical protein GMJAKD_13530 [Candidatus Electrothrix aarhusensis]
MEDSGQGQNAGEIEADGQHQGQDRISPTYAGDHNPRRQGGRNSADNEQPDKERRGQGE